MLRSALATLRAAAYRFHLSSKRTNGINIELFHPYRDGSGFISACEYRDPDSSTQHTDEEIADRQFRLFHDDDEAALPEHYERQPRSLSVGDVIGIDGRYLRCDVFGWSRTTRPHGT